MTDTACPPDALDVELRAFKHRSADVRKSRRFDDANAPAYWERGMFWATTKNRAVLCPSLASKYPGYFVYTIAVPPAAESSVVVPSRGLFVSRYAGAIRAALGRTHDAYESTYKTVSVHPPSETEKIGECTFVKMRVGETFPRPDTSLLEAVKWLQLGNKKDNVAYICKLAIDPGCDPAICKDDVTGDFYPYLLAAVYFLVKTEIFTASEPGMAPAAPNKATPSRMNEVD